MISTQDFSSNPPTFTYAIFKSLRHHIPNLLIGINRSLASIYASTKSAARKQIHQMEDALSLSYPSDKNSTTSNSLRSYLLKLCLDHSISSCLTLSQSSSFLYASNNIFLHQMSMNHTTLYGFNLS